MREGIRNDKVGDRGGETEALGEHPSEPTGSQVPTDDGDIARVCLCGTSHLPGHSRSMPALGSSRRLQPLPLAVLAVVQALPPPPLCTVAYGA